MNGQPEVSDSPARAMRTMGLHGSHRDREERAPECDRSCRDLDRRRSHGRVHRPAGDREPRAPRRLARLHAARITGGRALPTAPSTVTGADSASCAGSDAVLAGVRLDGRPGRGGRKAGSGGLRDAHRSRAFDQPVVHLDELPRGGQQAGSRRRERRAAAAAMEQFASKPLFQGPDPKDKRAPREAHAPGGGRKTPLVGNMQEGAQQLGADVLSVPVRPTATRLAIERKQRASPLFAED